MVIFDGNNPLDFWTSQATHYISKINLPEEFILEARSIVEGAFTKEWFDQIFSKKHRVRSLIPASHHPLASYFRIAGEPQIVSVMELAIYIKKFIDDKGLPSVIDVMKNSYSTGLMQLAFAYRFMRAGCVDVQLEPIVDSGKADIYFKYKGQPYLLECYVPRLKDVFDTSGYLKPAIEQIDKLVKSERLKIRVSLKLKKSISKKEGKEIGFMVATAIKEPNSTGRTVKENDSAFVEIEDLSQYDDESDLPPKDAKANEVQYWNGADWGGKIYEVEEKDIEKVRRGELEVHDHGSRFHVWRALDEKDKFDEAEFIKELAGKLSKKFKQTKRVEDNPKRILLAHCGLGGEKDEESKRIAQKIQHQLIPKHSDVACIILTHRRWMTNFRYRYDSMFLLGDRKHALPDNLYNTMAKDEFEKDVLWEF